MRKPLARPLGALGALVALLLFLVGVAKELPAQTSGSQHQHHAKEAESRSSDSAPIETFSLSIPDLAVLNQDGERLHFYSDLVKDKVVAINFIFTTCTTICPPLAATFSRVQTLTGDRVGKDFYLISVSVDPVVDTPPRLKAWGGKFKAGPGWTFVTGKKPEVDKLLRSLGVAPGQKEDHPPLVVIGNDATGKWTRLYGLSPATRLVELIEEMI